jgi:RsmE family RNA methyltransferase
VILERHFRKTKSGTTAGVNLILLERDELRHDSTVVLRDARAAHIRRVLRAVPEDVIRVGVIDGAVGSATVVAIDDEGVSLSCTLADVPPRPAVDLLLALPRPKVMRRLFAQCAALGVDRLMLTNAARVERDYFDTHILSPDSYRPLLIEGLQQARDTRLPIVSIHRQFRVLVEDTLDAYAPTAMRIVADPGEGVRLQTVVTTAMPSRLLLALGPEGGWNSFERRLLESRGFTPISMGVRTLRSDTACVALIALAHDALAAAPHTSSWDGASAIASSRGQAGMRQ